MKKISNPLTIIGLFAGIAEVAGTAVLPLVSNSLQRIFIFYVMLFPVFLVGLFFWTLNKNPNVLYAPSDFKDENNFMELLNLKKKAMDEKIKQAEEELQLLAETKPELAEDLKPIENKIKLIHNANISQKIGGTVFEILEFVREHPGCNLSLIETKHLNLSPSLIDTCLKILVKENFVRAKISPNQQITYFPIKQKKKPEFAEETAIIDDAFFYLLGKY